MADNQSLLRIKGNEDPLVTKNPTEPIHHLMSKKESVITKWLAWSNKAQFGSYLVSWLGFCALLHQPPSIGEHGRNNIKIFCPDWRRILASYWELIQIVQSSSSCPREIVASKPF